jgi:acyl-lipid omega-6 desaturase (Delta-12 desaturase)
MTSIAVQKAPLPKARDLVAQTRPYAREQVGRSWFVLLSTFAVLGATTAVAAAPSFPWLLRLGASLVESLLVVRAFILYHDHLHGALLRSSGVARVLTSAIGMFVMAPPRVWKQTHDYHHAHTAKIVGSNVGSFATMTTGMWARASRLQRLVYRITRHPLNMLFGVVTIFLYGMCISSFLRDPRRFWDSLVAIGLHAATAVLLIVFFGFDVWLYAVLIPATIACAFGGYLFYAQHNFPDMFIASRDEWEWVGAALESSSYMETGPVLAWFIGNIGYHHVHHLNPAIPFYRLPEAMAAIPALQDAHKTSLRPSDVAACFRLKLWDPKARQMVPYPRS